MSLSNLCELAGLALIVIAVGFLADLWWGALTGGILLLVYGLALDRGTPTPKGDG